MKTENDFINDDVRETFYNSERFKKQKKHVEKEILKNLKLPPINTAQIPSKLKEMPSSINIDETQIRNDYNEFIMKYYDRYISPTMFRCSWKSFWYSVGLSATIAIITKFITLLFDKIF